MSDHRVLARFQQEAVRAEIMRHVTTRITADQEAQTPLAAYRAAGDAWILRGIPVVGVPLGLGGAIPGTLPHGAHNERPTSRGTLPAS